MLEQGEFCTCRPGSCRRERKIKGVAIMDDMNKIQKYINNYRRRITKFLKPGIGISCNTIMAKKGGAIVEFTVGQNIKNSDTYTSVETLSKGLETINQNAFGGNLEGFNFMGTNTILEPNRMIFIKDSSESEWSDQAAQRDIQNVLRSSRGEKK